MTTALLANVIVMLIALLIDRAAGYSNRLYKIIRHPVVWIGALIRLGESVWPPAAGAPARQFIGGVIVTGLSLTIVIIITVALQRMLEQHLTGLLVLAIAASSLLAQKSLYDHVKSVAEGLNNSLQDGRDAVAHIVGRDPQELNESEVAKAALESLAENYSDGVVAPLFWGVLFGLPGIAAYKTINTLDSMIGYKNDKYQWFGMFAARLDDLVNLPASRFTALLLAGSALLQGPATMRRSLQAAFRDAHRHKSPNAGWPEAAMAGALDIQLGGPRSYNGQQLDLPGMGDGREVITLADLRAGLALYRRSLNLLWFLVAILASAIYVLG